MDIKIASIISPERIEQALMQRSCGFAQVNMEELLRQLDLFRAGYLRPAVRTWERMMTRDGDLGGVASKRFSDTARLDWNCYATEDSPQAEKHREALHYFYDNLVASDALEADVTGGFSRLVRQMMTAHAYKYSIHEVILRVDNAARREVTATMLHCPVWFFESRKGRLRFLQREGDYDGVEMAPLEWLTLVGHGFMQPCSIAYLIKWMPLADALLYSRRFGLPGIHGMTDAAKGSKEWDDFVEALQAYANDWVTATNRGAEIKLIEATGGGQNSPFQPLIDMTNQLYAKLFRGGDLSTQSKGDGTVGASLQDEEKEILLTDDCQMINEALNARIDRPLIRYLFNEEPLAFVRINPPQSLQVDRDIKSASFLQARGFRISKADAGMRLGWSEAQDDEEALGSPAIQPFDGAAPANPADALANEASLDNAGRTLLAQSIQADLQVLLRRLQAANEIEDNTLRVNRLKDILDEWAQIKKDITADPAATDAIMQLNAAALALGMETKPKTK